MAASLRASSFLATYSDFRLIKGRKVCQFVFEVPLEGANTAYEVLGGMPNPAAECWCAIARLDPHKVGGVATTPRDAGRDRTSALSPDDPPASHRLTTRAVMLCKDPLFCKFLEEHSGMKAVIEEEAAVYIRTHCGVTSRSEIKPGSAAAAKLDFIESAFICWRDKAKFVEAAE
jgi:hypothetical protein